jgi:hypothetical protein
LARSRLESFAQRAVAIFEAKADRAAFDFVPQRPFARAAAAAPFLRVGFFGFIFCRIVDRSLGISKLSLLFLVVGHNSDRYAEIQLPSRPRVYSASDGKARTETV